MEQLKAVDWFGTPPRGFGSGRSSLSVGLWRLDRDEPHEFRTEALVGTHMICAHLSGSITWYARLDERRYDAPCLPGTFCMARATESAHVSLRDAHASFVHFYLPTLWFAEQLEDLAPGKPPAAFELIDPMNGRSPGVHRCALHAARALREQGLAGRLEIEAAGLQLAAVLVREHSNLAGPRVPMTRARRSGLAPWQVARACEAMAAAVDGGAEEVSLAELASLVGLSANHFCRGFAHSTGLPPHRWMTRHRMERAKALMRDPRLSLSEIALAVGYGSQSAFGRVFARATAATPASWRRRLPR